MVTQQSSKRRVRARMAKSGESDSAARRMLIASGDAPEPEPPTVVLPVPDESRCAPRAAAGTPAL
jgi:hypothetical protein